MEPTPCKISHPMRNAFGLHKGPPTLQLINGPVLLHHQNFFCEQLNFWILPLFTLRATVPQKVFEHLWASLKTSIDLRNPYYIIEAVKAASPHLFNYSWLISLGMTALFLASTRLTEAISLGKYPKYKEYQRRVGMFS